VCTLIKEFLTLEKGKVMFNVEQKNQLIIIYFVRRKLMIVGLLDGKGLFLNAEMKKSLNNAKKGSIQN
jgi:hypothetical protein